MQGIILLGLRRFVQETFGERVWRAAQVDAGVIYRLYLPLQMYNTGELKRLVTAVSAATCVREYEVYDQFGEYIAPDLVRLYGTLLNPQWRLIDIFANANAILRRAMAQRTSEDEPSAIRTARRSQRDVLLTYMAPDRLCAMLKGFIRGMASHLNETVVVVESRCMLLGDQHCELLVRQRSFTHSRRPTVAPLSSPRRHTSARVSLPPQVSSPAHRAPSPARSRATMIPPPSAEANAEWSSVAGSAGLSRKADVVNVAQYLTPWPIGA